MKKFIFFVLLFAFGTILANDYTSKPGTMVRTEGKISYKKIFIVLEPSDASRYIVLEFDIFCKNTEILDKIEKIEPSDCVGRKTIEFIEILDKKNAKIEKYKKWAKILEKDIRYFVNEKIQMEPKDKTISVEITLLVVK